MNIQGRDKPSKEGEETVAAPTGYFRPETVAEAVEHLAAAPSTVVAGCTDYFPDLRDGPSRGCIVDITGIRNARGVEDAGDHFRIGFLTTWTDVVRTDLPAYFDALKQSAVEVGSIQIQNAATIVGNLCNASPAADGVPPLLALDAEVELSSLAGTRTMPLAAFITGNRQTERRPDELMTAILVPKPAGRSTSSFLKLGSRTYLVISIVMVATVLKDDGTGHVRRARISVGSCSVVARRLEALEAALAGQPLAPGLGAIATTDHLDVLSPIDDIRATADYRREAALTMVRRTLDTAAGGFHA